MVGEKFDETGWDVYEECRIAGAIIATGHEHSYERTRTLSSIQNQIIDSAWPDANNVRVGEGSSFVFVSGLGGLSIRNQDRCSPSAFPYGCNGEWASIYTSNQGANHGALFCSFNVGGEENKASCYFKDINGNIPDQFDVTSFNNVPGGSPPPQPPGETQPPDPTTPVLESAELIISPNPGPEYMLSWSLPQSSLGSPDGGYDIFIDGVDTNEEHRTTSLQTQIGNLVTSIEHCFSIQARWTQVGDLPVGNEMCVPPMESTTPPTEEPEPPGETPQPPGETPQPPGGTSPPPSGINISSCQTLNIPGATYVLTSDITTTEKCFTITADGITLHGNGHKLVGDASGELGDESGDFGIHIISSNGVTIQNIDLSYWVHGIEIESSDETTVKNNYIHNINKYGVQLDGSKPEYNLVYNNYFQHSQNGVHAWPSDANYNSVYLNTFFDSNHEQVHWHGSNCINEAYHNNFIDGPDHGFHDECSGGDNQFYENYFNNYDEPSEGCDDVNSDGFCDAPFFGEGNQDNTPYTTQNGWGTPGAPLTPGEALSSGDTPPPVIGSPPSFDGTLHDRLICDVETAVASSPVGALGTVAGVSPGGSGVSPGGSGVSPGGSGVSPGGSGGGVSPEDSASPGVSGAPGVPHPFCVVYGVLSWLPFEE